MKFSIGVIVVLSLLFLFGGLLAVGAFSNKSTNNKAEKIYSPKYLAEQPATHKTSMKQIDSVTSQYNYPFTSANANGAAALPH